MALNRLRNVALQYFALTVLAVCILTFPAMSQAKMNHPPYFPHLDARFDALDTNNITKVNELVDLYSKEVTLWLREDSGGSRALDTPAKVKRRLLAGRAVCKTGYYLCDDEASCCPTGDTCCIDSCCPTGTTCCNPLFCCREGSFCCSEIECCYDGQICSYGICADKAVTVTSTITHWTTDFETSYTTKVGSITTTIDSTVVNTKTTTISNTDTATSTHWETITTTVTSAAIAKRASAIPAATATLLETATTIVPSTLYLATDGPTQPTVTLQTHLHFDPLASSLYARGVLVARGSTTISYITVTKTTTDWTYETINNVNTQYRTNFITRTVTNTEYANAETTVDVTSTVIETVVVREVLTTESESGQVVTVTSTAEGSTSTVGFVQGTPESDSTNSSNSNNNHDPITLAAKIGIGVGAGVGAVALATAVGMVWRRACANRASLSVSDQPYTSSPFPPAGLPGDPTLPNIGRGGSGGATQPYVITAVDAGSNSQQHPAPISQTHLVGGGSPGEAVSPFTTPSPVSPPPESANHYGSGYAGHDRYQQPRPIRPPPQGGAYGMVTYGQDYSSGFASNGTSSPSSPVVGHYVEMGTAGPGQGHTTSPTQEVSGYSAPRQGYVEMGNDGHAAGPVQEMYADVQGSPLPPQHWGTG